MILLLGGVGDVVGESVVNNVVFPPLFSYGLLTTRGAPPGVPAAAEDVLLVAEKLLREEEEPG